MQSRTFISGLLYPRMKTDRAGEQLKFVNDEWARFQKGEPYAITEHDDPENGLHVVRVKLNSGDPRIPIAIGEFAYALRSALDQLVWQLALLSGRQPGNKSTFPIQSSDGKLDRRRFMNATWNVPCEAVSIIKDLQPYTRRNGFKAHPLWQLNKLCNLDKHATISISHTLVNIKTSGPPAPISIRQFGDARKTYTDVAYPIELKGQVRIEPEPPIMILGKPLEAPGPEFTLSAKALGQIHHFVRYEVLPQFERFFPGGGGFLIHDSDSAKK